MKRNRRRRERKAALLAVFCYFCVLFLGLGMLKAAQKTRQVLYGGTPALAQLSGDAHTLSLGGGEWQIPLPSADEALHHAERTAAALPPCLCKYFCRLGILADLAADYTAQHIFTSH